MTDDALVTKFVLCGGTLWNGSDTYWNNGVSTDGKPVWFAIAPGQDEHTGHAYKQGLTPRYAVEAYIAEYGAPWDKPA